MNNFFTNTGDAISGLETTFKPVNLRIFTTDKDENTERFLHLSVSSVLSVVDSLILYSNKLTILGQRPQVCIRWL
jgi:hypothetical protein